MIYFLARRAAWGALVVLLVWTATFVIAFIVPGDPARALAGPHASPADVARLRTSLGLDRPLIDQFIGHLGRLVSGDLGYSYSFRRPVADLVLQRLPQTVLLAAAALFAQIAIGLPLGVLAATRRGGRSDRAASGLSLVLAALPVFWLGHVLILLLAFLPALWLGFELFPVGRSGSADLRSVVLPALTVGLCGCPAYIRLMRASLIDELGQQYLIAARARGVSERVVLWRHAVRNALLPVVAQLGLDMGIFLGGLVVVERVFSWPGIGDLALDAIERSDLPLILGTVTLASLFIVAGSLLADILSARIDPRLRTGGEEG